MYLIQSLKEAFRGNLREMGSIPLNFAVFAKGIYEIIELYLKFCMVSVYFSHILHEFENTSLDFLRLR